MHSDFLPDNGKDGKKILVVCIFKIIIRNWLRIKNKFISLIIAMFSSHACQLLWDPSNYTRDTIKKLKKVKIELWNSMEERNNFSQRKYLS